MTPDPLDCLVSVDPRDCVDPLQSRAAVAPRATDDSAEAGRKRQRVGGVDSKFLVPEAFILCEEARPVLHALALFRCADDVIKATAFREFLQLYGNSQMPDPPGPKIFESIHALKNGSLAMKTQTWSRQAMPVALRRFTYCCCPWCFSAVW